MKQFETYVNEWEANARKDAYWAVLTSSQHEELAWDREQFFQTGIHEIRVLMEYIESRQLPISLRGRALDFGCGVGRLTQALSRYFAEVCGVDISENMVCKAKEALGIESSTIQYLHNPNPNLKMFESDNFDFIYSNIVLQHIGSEYQLQYLREFARVIKPGGWIIVQIPSMRIYANSLGKIKGSIVELLPYKIKKWIQVRLLKNRSRSLSEFDFEINICSESSIRKMAVENHLEIAHVAYTNSCEPDFGGNLIFSSYEEALQRPGFLSPMYFMRKTESK